MIASPQRCAQPRFSALAFEGLGLLNGYQGGQLVEDGTCSSETKYVMCSTTCSTHTVRTRTYVRVQWNTKTTWPRDVACCTLRAGPAWRVLHLYSVQNSGATSQPLLLLQSTPSNIESANCNRNPDGTSSQDESSPALAARGRSSYSMHNRVCILLSRRRRHSNRCRRRRPGGSHPAARPRPACPCWPLPSS